MPSNSESNLERLKTTDLIQDYVEHHKGEWNHQDWLDFCALIEEKGFTPVDLDQVGLLLEMQKADYWKSVGKE